MHSLTHDRASHAAISIPRPCHPTTPPPPTRHPSTAPPALLPLATLPPLSAAAPSKGLSTGAKAGIAIAVVLVVVAVGAFFFVRSRKASPTAATGSYTSVAGGSPAKEWK
jgi:hypothetical protein